MRGPGSRLPAVLRGKCLCHDAGHAICSYSNDSHGFAVSMMALSGVNCRKIGEEWVLAIDVGEKCTLSDMSGGLFSLAVAAIIIYPIGVPTIIYLLLWFQRIPHLAERKKNR